MSPCSHLTAASDLSGRRAADIISCVEFSHDGNLLATGDKGGRVVIFQRDDSVSVIQYESHGLLLTLHSCPPFSQSRKSVPKKSDYSVYTTFQSHEPEFDYLKSLEIEEKINKISWLKRKNAAQFLLSTNDKTIKLWKVSERDKQLDGCTNFIRSDDTDSIRSAIRSTSCLRVPQVKPSDLVIEASPRKVYANAHTYHVNSISVNSDQETFLSADDLRINVWHQDITDESFSESLPPFPAPDADTLPPDIVDIKPANMEELTEVITAADYHPHHCNYFVYSSSKGILRLCDMRAAALCDQHAKGTRLLLLSCSF